MPREDLRLPLRSIDLLISCTDMSKKLKDGLRDPALQLTKRDHIPVRAWLERAKANRLMTAERDYKGNEIKSPKKVF